MASSPYEAAKRALERCWRAKDSGDGEAVAKAWKWFIAVLEANPKTRNKGSADGENKNGKA